MRQYKSEAVILDATDVFDADRSFLIFARELGKVRARAKGVRRPTSRLTGHLLSYIPTQLELVDSGGFLLITQAQIHSAYASHAAYPENSLLFLGKGMVVAEALNRLFPEAEPHPDVYDGLVYTLDRLRELADSARETAADLVVAEFLLKCLAELGYRPELGACIVTGMPVTEEFVAWNSRLGGIVGEGGFETARVDSQRCNPKSIVVLRQLLRPEFWAERLGMDEDVRDEVVGIAYDYVQHQIGQPLKSLAAGSRFS